MISQIDLSIARFDPEIDLAPSWRDYTIRTHPGMTVQDALVQVRDEQDGSLRFRESEPGGFSGVGAVSLNGRPVLAVREPLPLAANEIRIGPLANHAVIADLVVDDEVARNRQARLSPWMQRVAAPDPERPTPMTREELDRLQRSEYCNGCGICDAVVRGAGMDFLGAAFLLKTYRLAADVRDDFDRERLQMAVGPDGMWRLNLAQIASDPCPYKLAPFAQIDKLRRAAALNGFRDPG